MLRGRGACPGEDVAADGVEEVAEEDFNRALDDGGELEGVSDRGHLAPLLPVREVRVTAEPGQARHFP